MKRLMSSRNVGRIARGRTGEHGVIVIRSADQKEQFFGNDFVLGMHVIITKMTRRKNQKSATAPAVSIFYFFLK